VRRLTAPSPAERGTLAALGVACVLLGAAVADAIRLDPPPIPADMPVTLTRASDLRITGPSDAALASAAAADPFSPDRVGVGTRDADQEVAPDELPGASASAPEPPRLRLLGVVVLGDGRGSAALSVAGGAAQLVRVGQQVDRWVLERVESGTATLLSRDGRLVLRLDDAAGAGGAT
jgi:hypothetical protein